MIAFFRVFIALSYFLLVSIVSTIVFLFRRNSTNNVYLTTQRLALMTKLLGLKVEVRIPDEVKNIKSAVYIANHQNTWDIFNMCHGLRPHTVTVGKKSLQWIPFFGPMYKVTGNILIDRKNTTKAMDTITITAKNIKDKNMSVWLFPEGTRSNGYGLQPFKTGAIRTAEIAGVPIVPICMSNTHEQIKLNRWDNGKVIIEFLQPVYVADEEDNIRKVTNDIQDNMRTKLDEISLEATGQPYPAYKKKPRKKK